MAKNLKLYRIEISKDEEEVHNHQRIQICMAQQLNTYQGNLIQDPTMREMICNLQGWRPASP